MQKLTTKNLPRKNDNKNLEKIKLKDVIRQYMSDLGLPMKGLTDDFIAGKLKAAKRVHYSDYKDFKKSMQAIYGKEK